MNIIKQIYCRSFQIVERIVLPFLPYRIPKSLHNINEIVDTLKNASITNLLLITDSQIRSFALTIPLEEQLQNHKISYTIYDGTNPNPTIQNIEDAKALYLSNKCQAIIALGGGSSIDCAKIVGARVVRPKKNVTKMKGLFKILKKHLCSSPFQLLPEQEAKLLLPQ